jgi:serine/threonine protein kinase
MVEFLDRFGMGYGCDVWLVRVGDRLANAHVYDDENLEWLDGIANESTRWVGVEHPSLVPLLELAWDGRRLVIVTGDERGPTFVQAASLLTDPVERETWAVSELANICDALTELRRHDRNFVHRRACHEQILVAADGHARLRAAIAWVAARARAGYLGRGNSLVSPQWMSPEQIEGKSLSPASDVFQLAATLYAAITLKRPFQRDTDYDTLTAVRDAAPPPPPSTTNAPVRSLVMANLARDPSARLRDPAELGEALRAIVPETPALLAAKMASLRPDKKPAPNHSMTIVGARCHMQWDALAPTVANGVRHCASCKHDVVHVRSLEAVIPLLGKRCIKYDGD